MGKQKNSRTVAIIGCEHVGVTAIYSLARSSSVDRVVVVGDNATHIARQVNQLLDRIEFEPPKVTAGRTAKAAAAEIAVIAVAPYHLEDESKGERVKRSEIEVRREVRELVDSGFDGVLLVISNPIEAMSAAAFSEAGLSHNRVFGLAAASQLEGVTWCTGVHSANYIDNCDPTCPFFDKVLSSYYRSTHALKNGVSAKRALATCVTRVCDAVFNDERSILPLVCLATTDYPFEKRFVKMQCVVGRNGIERTIDNSERDDNASGRRGMTSIGISDTQLRTRLRETPFI